MMLPFLFAMRSGIIIWVTLSLVPVEFMFDLVEIEIERRS